MIPRNARLTLVTLPFVMALFAPRSARAVQPAPADPPTEEPPKEVAPREETPKEEKVREQAKTAELTRLAPSPKDVSRPAYQLYAETDLPLLGIGLVLAATRLVRTQPAYCAPLCDTTTLNALDRTTAGFYDTTWSTASEIGLYGTMAVAAGILTIDEGFLPALNDAVVIAESALSATAISSLATLAAGRPRPFLFGEKAPLDVRNSADAGQSFVSSHASVTFAVAVSTYITTRRLHPHPGELLPTFMLVGGLAAASFVATARVEAGRHFITDTIAGAIIGSSVGVLIPALHSSPVKVLPRVTPQEGSIQLMGVF
jgi:membrane-associated phospholipid phosphatase